MTKEDHNELLNIVQSVVTVSKQLLDLDLYDDLNDSLLLKLQDEQEMLRNSASDIIASNPHSMSNEIRALLQECIDFEKRIKFSLQLQSNDLQERIDPSSENRKTKNGYQNSEHSYTGYFIDNQM